MLLLSACRTAHTAAKEESATQTAETSQSSVASESSFASLLSALSLRADSIVMWMLPSESDSAATYDEEDSSYAPADTNLSAGGSGFTARSSGKPARNTPRVAKILIGGLQMNAVQSEEKATSSLARDSLSARESNSSSSSEKEESKPPSTHARAYICIGILLALLGFAAYTYIRKRYLQ